MLANYIFHRGENAKKQKQPFGIVPGTGRDQLCLCVPGPTMFMCPLPPGEKGKHINNIPRTLLFFSSLSLSGKCWGSPGTVPGQSGTIPSKLCLCIFLFIIFYLALCMRDSYRSPEVSLPSPRVLLKTGVSRDWVCPWCPKNVPRVSHKLALDRGSRGAVP